MSNPQETFQLECNDLLTDMEEALLILESNPEDVDQINAIFRAMHTIKGTSGVFGYDDIVSFTHVAESVLDKVRANEINITGDLVALLLESMDHTKVLIDLAMNEQEMVAEDKVRENELLAQLNTFLGVVAETQVESSSNVIESVSESVADDTVESNYWHISLRFDKDVLEHGMDPLSFFSYLKKMGDIVKLITIYDELVLDEKFNPESNYLGFEIVYDTDVDKQKIEQSFEFVKEMCLLYILPPRASITHYAELINSLPEENMRLGEILVASGAISEAELGNALNSQVETPDESSKPTLIGEVLVENKAVHPEVVEAALNKQTETQSVVKPQTILRVDAEKLDALINLVGELVIAGATTNMVATRLGDEQLIESMSGMSRLVENIRDNALNLRMVQVGETFNRFKRVVRDVSRELGKDIKLTIKGAETELDKTVVEKIADPLMHLVRNAMDHGIESAEDRESKGKDAVGHLTLNAYHDAGYIVIEVEDDGKGLDRDRILAKALEKNLITESQIITDHEVYRLVFEAGFSTAETITNLSGRGVGMDVVNKNIEALRGTVDIDSDPGQGSKVSIRLPLTLAIIDGFLVKVGDSSYVIPLDMVHECIDLSNMDNDNTAQGYINLRGEVLPFLNLRDYFKEEGAESIHKSIVVVKQGNRKAGFVVDELLGELQTVIKPMGKILKSLRGISGATILGSGQVAVILDVPNLIQRATRVSHIDTGNSPAQSSATLH
ncbi:MAG: chemotaxis protein CheA [Gammaproteobacteria bacterium]|nr:chemotaxis protein CheA [Gammaproteobacteria bacterium]